MASPQIENGHTKISNELLDEIIKLPISGRELRVLLAIVRTSYGYRQKECSVSLQYLADKTGIPDRKHVYRVIETLVKKNLVEVDGEQKKTAKKSYRIQKDYEKWFTKRGQLVHKKVTVCSNNGFTKRGQLVHKRVTDGSQKGDKLLIKKTSKENHKENTRLCDRKKFDEAFEKIWKLYPKRIGKKAAKRHFNATVKTPEDFEKLCAAQKNYLGSDRVKRGYVQNGSTWFNQWQDWIDYTEASMEEPEIDISKRML